MAGRVLIRVAVNLVDQVEGTEVWVDDGPNVSGMVAGGYWEVVERQGGVSRSGPAGKRERPAKELAETLGEPAEDSDGVADPS